jgi:hypothetical protein
MSCQYDKTMSKSGDKSIANREIAVPSSSAELAHVVLARSADKRP